MLARKMGSNGQSLSKVSRLAASWEWVKSVRNMGALQQSLLSIEKKELPGWPKGGGSSVSLSISALLGHFKLECRT
jgi:hypothetical protein